MGVEAINSGRTAVISLHDKLMGGVETRELRETTYKLISDEIVNVVLDLSNVQWVNSAGIGTILACYTSLINRNGQLKLACVTDKVQSLLTITRLINIFEVYDTVEDAIKSFGT